MGRRPSRRMGRRMGRVGGRCERGSRWTWTCTITIRCILCDGIHPSVLVVASSDIDPSLAPLYHPCLVSLLPPFLETRLPPSLAPFLSPSLHLSSPVSAPFHHPSPAPLHQQSPAPPFIRLGTSFISIAPLLPCLSHLSFIIIHL